MNKINNYDDVISKVSSEVGIPKELLQSILFREQIFYSLGDATDVDRVKIGHLTGLNKIKYKNIGGYFNSASIGMGQIFPDVAGEAEAAVQQAQNIPPGQKVSYTDEQLFERLQDPNTNIYYVAMELARRAKEYGIDLKNASQEDIEKVLARYNGTGDEAAQYGRETYKYYDAFNKYNQATGRSSQ